MNSSLIRMVMVDDHLALLDSFHRDFSTENGFDVVAKLVSADVVDAVCRRLRPALVLMDVCTADGASGLDALSRLRPEFPDMKILMMSGFNEMTYVSRARELGADGFLFKTRSFDLFMEAARGVFEGNTYFPEPRVIPSASGEAPFTEREFEILRLLCQKKNRTEIAETLSITTGTVKRHIDNMREKGCFDSTLDMVVHVVAKGWINPDF